MAQRCVTVAETLGLAPAALERIRLGALLHDIGKLGVPRSLVDKVGPLTESERRLVQSHSAFGAHLVQRVAELQDLAPLIRHHHERFDGALNDRFPGYPDGLAADAIPLGSRIIAVVDAYDAMISERPYRPRRPAAAARYELKRERGRQFDPMVVDAFIESLGAAGDRSRNQPSRSWAAADSPR